MSDQQRNFLGIPIQGEPGEKQTPQRTQEEFAAIMQPVLDDPTVLVFGWKQYTPYFNDGDPCTFSAASVWAITTDSLKASPVPYAEWLLGAFDDQIRSLPQPVTASASTVVLEALLERSPVGVVPAAEAVDLEELIGEVHSEYWEWTFEEGSKHGLGECPYGHVENVFSKLPYVGPDEARYLCVQALNAAVQGGAFDHVLLELFGDHAMITVRKDRIQVDEYSHD